MSDFFDDDTVETKTPKESTHEERVGKILDTLGAEPQDITDPDQVQDGLSYKMLCSELLAEIYTVREKIRVLKEIEAGLVQNARDLLKERRGAIQFDGYTIIAKDRKPPISFNWEAYIKEVNGEEAIEEIKRAIASAKAGKISYAYAKEGKASLPIEVVKSESTKEDR